MENLKIFDVQEENQQDLNPDKFWEIDIVFDSLILEEAYVNRHG